MGPSEMAIARSVVRREIDAWPGFDQVTVDDPLAASSFQFVGVVNSNFTYVVGGDS